MRNIKEYQRPYNRIHFDFKLLLIKQMRKSSIRKEEI